MREKIKKILCFMLAACLIFAIGCKKKSPAEEIDKTPRLRGIKIIDDKYLVKNGASEYKILVSANATSVESVASSELNSFFFEATGANIPVEKEGSGAWTRESKIISLGNTTALVSSGLTADGDLLRNGFHIKTVGDSVFVYGGQNSVRYGVYNLLYYLFGFEYFASDCYYIDENVTTLNLLDFDVKTVPDIEYADSGSGMTDGNDQTYKYALGYCDVANHTGYGGGYHNSFNMLDPDEYYADHKEWYSTRMETPDRPAQLCYTRKVDEYYPALLEKFKQVITENPHIDKFTFTAQDNWYWCTCDSCNADAAEYGSSVAGYLRLLNRLAADVEDWVNSDGKPTGGVKKYVVGMAYLGSETAPTKNVEKLKLRDNVILIYAPITANYYYPMNDEKNNAAVYRNAIGWSDLCDNMYYWIYNQNDFRNYMAFYDNYNAMSENYRFIRDRKGQWVFDQGQWNNGNSTGFQVLRTYLAARLAWDADIDYGAAIGRFFDNYFGPASGTMYKMFTSLRLTYAKAVQDGKITGGTQNIMRENIWSFAYLSGTLGGYIDRAQKDIEPLKQTDAALYEKIKNRIILESLFPRYTAFNLYRSDFADIAAERKAFIDDCRTLGVTKYGENTEYTIEALAGSWGV